MTHVPRWQLGVPAGHTWPHAPQLLGSRARSAHSAPHVAWSTAHEDAHCPSAHTWLGPQATPQLIPLDEQWAEEALVSTQAPPQYCTGAPPKHVVPHDPEVHPVPVGHLWPQLPQLAPSVLVLTHAPLHELGVFP